MIIDIFWVHLIRSIHLRYNHLHETFTVGSPAQTFGQRSGKPAGHPTATTRGSLFTKATD